MRLAAAWLVGPLGAAAANEPCRPTPRASSARLTALRRQLHGIAVALLLVLATTLVALFLRQYLGILRGAVLYLVPVMIAGYQFGVIPALAAAVAGV